MADAVPGRPGRPGPLGRLGRLGSDPRLRYVVVGAVAAGTYAILFATGWIAVGETHPRAYPLVVVVAHIVSGMVVYPLQRRWVFGVPAGGGRLIAGFLRFYLVYAGGLVASLAGLPLLVEVFGVPVLPAQAAILLAVPVVSYLVHRSWTFRPRPAR